jgi:uncharacterized Zn finger protein
VRKVFMPSKLTIDIIRALSTPQSFERGQQYYRAGAVFNTSRQGDLLVGECEGSMAPAYRLRVELDEGGVRAAFCTCPYEMGGYCKHIVALLLVYLYTPDEFIERRRIDEMLAGLNQADLLGLIHKMVEHEPNLYDWLEMAIPVVRTSPKAEESPTQEKRRSQVSTKAYQRQIRNILHSLDGYRMSEAYWMMGSMVEELAQIVDSAEAFLQAGDAEGAITILMVLLEEVADCYDQFDDSDGELGSFLDELGQPLAEAILSIDLNETERQKLKDDLEPILDELSDYGIDGLEVALSALEQGWTQAEVGNDLETESENEWDDEDGVEWYSDVDLTQAKLNVLERQGRTDEYLKLCRQAGEYRRYTLKLLEVGRHEEAMLIASNNLKSAEDALSVARKLRDLGQVRDAIAIGERGLSLAGHKHSLGAWLGPLEEAQGRTDPALQAYLAAFTSIPSLELYKTVLRLAGSDSNELRPRMIEILQAAPHSSVLAEVYLLEGDWDGAINVADQAGFWSYSLIEKVADAVLSHRPDWVILVSIKQAKGLIEKTQSKYYPAAARWLMKAKMAYLASDRQSEWQAYFSNLKTTYARRPALQRELRGL